MISDGYRYNDNDASGTDVNDGKFFSYDTSVSGETLQHH